MILILISALLSMFLLQIFSLSFALQGLNRAIVNTPIEMMFTAVSVSESGISFNKNSFEEIVNHYYEDTLTRYCKSYQTSFYYYDPIDESMCLSNSCTAVEITINCKLIYNYDFERIMYYKIKENYHG